MCGYDHGEELRRVFRKYYRDRIVDDEDFAELDTLSSAGYIELFVRDGAAYARAGPIGRLFRV